MQTHLGNLDPEKTPSYAKKTQFKNLLTPVLFLTQCHFKERLPKMECYKAEWPTFDPTYANVANQMHYVSGKRMLDHPSVDVLMKMRNLFDVSTRNLEATRGVRGSGFTSKMLHPVEECNESSIAETPEILADEAELESLDTQPVDAWMNSSEQENPDDDKPFIMDEGFIKFMNTRAHAGLTLEAAKREYQKVQKAKASEEGAKEVPVIPIHTPIVNKRMESPVVVSTPEQTKKSRSVTPSSSSPEVQNVISGQASSSGDSPMQVAETPVSAPTENPTSPQQVLELSPSQLDDAASSQE
jgi:hypothetical protein